MKLKSILILFSVILFGFIIYENISAFSTGIVGLTNKNGQTEGCSCHGLNPTPGVNVVINGPAEVEAGDTAFFTLFMTGGPGISGGCDIAAYSGLLFPAPTDPTLQRLQAGVNAFELTHISPKPFLLDTVGWTFMYIAPDLPNTFDTLFAVGNSSNLNGSTDGDQWNFAMRRPVYISKPTSVSTNNSIAETFELKQNYPNPFNPNTKISFTLHKSGNVDLAIYDSRGTKVASIIKNEFYIIGDYSVPVDAARYRLMSGVYFYKLTSGNNSDVKKMIFVK
jgi:hypothetical protein